MHLLVTQFSLRLLNREPDYCISQQKVSSVTSFVNTKARTRLLSADAVLAAIMTAQRLK